MSRARRKKATRRTAGNSAVAATQKSAGLAALRERIVKHVSGKAFGIVKFATEGAERGDLSTMKYLFEMIGLFPVAADSEAGAEEEPGLARLVLDQLNLVNAPALPEEESVIPEPATSNSVE